MMKLRCPECLKAVWPLVKVTGVVEIGDDGKGGLDHTLASDLEFDTECDDAMCPLCEHEGRPADFAIIESNEEKTRWVSTITS